MVVHWRADHAIRVPRPDLTKDIGVPNACTPAGCHADRPLSWVTGAFDKWYGTARKPHYGTVLAAGRRADPAAKADLLRLAGDALSPTIVRATALSLLGRYSGDDVIAAFRGLSLDEEPLIRRTAVAEVADPGRGGAHRPARAAALGPVPRGSPRGRRPARRERRRSCFSPTSGGACHGARRLREGHGVLAGFLVGRPQPRVALREAGRPDARRVVLPARGRGGRSLAPPKTNLAILLAGQGKDDEAEKLLREVVAENPDQAQVAYSLGLLLAGRGKMEEAATLLARAAAGLPENARVAYNAGLALSRVGRNAEAERLLRRAVDQMIITIA